MNKFFTNKDVLVAVFKLAPNPTEKLRKFRFNKILQMLEEAKDRFKGYQCYLAFSSEVILEKINKISDTKYFGQKNCKKFPG